PEVSCFGSRKKHLIPSVETRMPVVIRVAQLRYRGFSVDVRLHGLRTGRVGSWSEYPACASCAGPTVPRKERASGWDTLLRSRVGDTVLEVSGSVPRAGTGSSVSSVGGRRASAAGGTVVARGAVIGAAGAGAFGVAVGLGVAWDHFWLAPGRVL